MIRDMPTLREVIEEELEGLSAYLPASFNVGTLANALELAISEWLIECDEIKGSWEHAR